MTSEMAQIVEYNFHKVAMPASAAFWAACITPDELALRLWNNFRWKGFILTTRDYEPLGSSDFRLTAEHLRAQLRVAQGALDGATATAARDFARSAWRTIDNATLSRLMFKYRYDFELFDFSKALKEFNDLRQ